MSENFSRFSNVTNTEIRETFEPFFNVTKLDLDFDRSGISLEEELVTCEILASAPCDALFSLRAESMRCEKELIG